MSDLPTMDASSAWARLSRRLDDLVREFAEFRSASGTLDKATISKGELTVIDPDTGALVLIKPGGIEFVGLAGSEFVQVGAIRYTADVNGFDDVLNGFRVAGPDGMDIIQAGRFATGTKNFLQFGDIDGFASLEVLNAYADTIRHHSVSNGYVESEGTVWIRGSGVRLQGLGGVPLPTTGSAANVSIDAVTGQVFRSTSSLKYKQDVEDVAVDPTDVLKLQGRTWRQRTDVETDPDTERRYVGFIAEEVHDAGLGALFVDYDEQGRPDAIQYDRMTVGLLELVKAQQAQIATLTARVDALEAA